MSTSSINSQLNIVTPASTVSTGPAVESNEFNRILSTATKPLVATEKPAPTRQPEVKESESSDVNSSDEVSNQEPATNAEDKNESNTTADEQPVVVPVNNVEAKEEGDSVQDEVVLSDAVEALVELASEESNQQSATVADNASNNEATADNQLPQDSVNSEILTEASTTKDLPSEAEEIADQPELRPASFDKALAEETKSRESPQIDSEAESVEVLAIEKPESSDVPSKDTAPKSSNLLNSANTESAHHTEVSQEAQSTTVVEKSIVGVATQQSTAIAAGVPDHEPRITDNTSSTVSTVSTVSDKTLPQISPQATQQRVETFITPAGTEPSMPTVDPGRFVHRVANAFRSDQQQDGQIQLRLSPPELGSLKLEIAVRQGVLTAKMETETVDARRALLDNLPVLRQRLAEQDIRIDKFEVDIRRDSGQSQHGAEERHSRRESSQPNANHHNRLSKQPEVAATRVGRSVLHLTPESLDVRI